MSNKAIEGTFAKLALLSKIYVYSCVFVFSIRAAKTNWVISVIDAEKWDIFAKWFQVFKNKTFIVLDCFSTWASTWIRYKDDWTKMEWHI